MGYPPDLSTTFWPASSPRCASVCATCAHMYVCVETAAHALRTALLSSVRGAAVLLYAARGMRAMRCTEMNKHSQVSLEMIVGTRRLFDSIPGMNFLSVDRRGEFARRANLDRLFVSPAANYFVSRMPGRSIADPFFFGRLRTGTPTETRSLGGKSDNLQFR